MIFHEKVGNSMMLFVGWKELLWIRCGCGRFLIYFASLLLLSGVVMKFQYILGDTVTLIFYPATKLSSGITEDDVALLPEDLPWDVMGSSPYFNDFMVAFDATDWVLLPSIIKDTNWCNDWTQPLAPLQTPLTPHIVAFASFPYSGEKLVGEWLSVANSVRLVPINQMTDSDLLDPVAFTQRLNLSSVLLQTHQPLFASEAQLHTFNSIIYIVRNPLDTIIAAFKEEYQTRLSRELTSSHFFHVFAKSKALLWRRSLQNWRTECKKRDIRMQIIRFEDAVRNRATTLAILLNLTSNATWHDDDIRCFLNKHEPSYQQLWQFHWASRRERQKLDPAVTSLIFEETKSEFCALGYDKSDPLYSSDSKSPCSELNSLIIADERPLPPSFSSIPDSIPFDAWNRSNEIISHPSISNVDSSPLQSIKSDTREMPKIHLLTSYFRSFSLERQEELDFALMNNLNNEFVSMVHLWIESNLMDAFAASKFFFMNHTKLRVVASERQPLFLDYFTYANDNLVSQIAVIQNFDIYWTRSIGLMASLLPGMVFAISRQSNLLSHPETLCAGGHNQNFCENYRGSHDAFAVIPPIDPTIARRLAFKQNTWGGENVVIESLRYGGWTVTNPCKDIIAVHSHCSGVRKNTGVRINLPERRGNRQYSVAVPSSLKVICKEFPCTLVE